MVDSRTYKDTPYRGCSVIVLNNASVQSTLDVGRFYWPPLFIGLFIGLCDALPMNHNFSSQLPAPCIVDNGIVVNKADMLRLLKGLRHVRYIHRQDDEITSTGEGCVMEAFADPAQATLVANRSLYLNVHSFDYIEMVHSEKETSFALVQDNRCLCLTPVAKEKERPNHSEIDAATLEAIVTEALSASWDASMDDERNF